MLPAITAMVKGVLDRMNPEPLSLGLKAAGGISFDAVNAGWYGRNGYPGIYAILSGGLPAWSGEPVSVGTALNHSVVYACQKIISESVGFIPALMLQERGGEKQPARDKPMFGAMKNAPNDEITAQTFTELLTGHAVMQGNAYSQIIRRSGTGEAVELHPIAPEAVYPDREKSGKRRLTYTIKTGNSPDKTYTVERGKPHDILHIRGLGWDGVRGYSAIAVGRQSMGTAIAAERNVARFFANGGRVPYLLKKDSKFKTDQDFDKFRETWEKVYSEPHRAPMLEGDMHYETIGLSMADAQMLETRLFTIHEICRWFSISPHLVGDLTHATFSNIEELALQFVKMTLATWLTRWEQEFWRCVLTDEEKSQGYFLRHNVKELLRGDFRNRMAGYATALQNGYMNQNEVRDEEDMNHFEGGDDFHIQLNMQTLPGGQPTESQQASLMKLGSSKKGSYFRRSAA
jgi:HK97 family phage portal protein